MPREKAIKDVMQIVQSEVGPLTHIGQAASMYLTLGPVAFNLTVRHSPLALESGNLRLEHLADSDCIQHRPDLDFSFMAYCDGEERGAIRSFGCEMDADQITVFITGRSTLTQPFIKQCFLNAGFKDVVDDSSDIPRTNPKVYQTGLAYPIFNTCAVQISKQAFNSPKIQQQLASLCEQMQMIQNGDESKRYINHTVQLLNERLTEFLRDGTQSIAHTTSREYRPKENQYPLDAFMFEVLVHFARCYHSDEREHRANHVLMKILRTGILSYLSPRVTDRVLDRLASTSSRSDDVYAFNLTIAELLLEYGARASGGGCADSVLEEALSTVRPDTPKLDDNEQRKLSFITELCERIAASIPSESDPLFIDSTDERYVTHPLVLALKRARDSRRPHSPSLFNTRAESATRTMIEVVSGQSISVETLPLDDFTADSSLLETAELLHKTVFRRVYPDEAALSDAMLSESFKESIAKPRQSQFKAFVDVIRINDTVQGINLFEVGEVMHQGKPTVLHHIRLACAESTVTRNRRIMTLISYRGFKLQQQHPDKEVITVYDALNHFAYLQAKIVQAYPFFNCLEDSLLAKIIHTFYPPSDEVVKTERGLTLIQDECAQSVVMPASQSGAYTAAERAKSVYERHIATPGFSVLVAFRCNRENLEAMQRSIQHADPGKSIEDLFAGFGIQEQETHAP